MNDSKKIFSEEELEKELKELTIERLQSIPSNYKISVGDGESLSRVDAIKNVEEGSDLGQELVDIQIEFLRDMAQGELYKYE